MTGVIVISKLGLHQFDADDLRLLEVMAGHASVALENARLYEAQRREAESAKALLEFSRDLAEAAGIADVAERATAGTVRILESPSASVWLQSATDGALERLAALPEPPEGEAGGARIPVEHLEPWLARREPFTVDPEDYAGIEGVPEGTEGRFAAAPFMVEGRWGVVAAAIATKSSHEDRDLELLGSIARQTRLALQTAASYESLERTFLSTVEALANALEANDEYTSSHARWITDLSLKVGVELGLEPAALKRLELGALFHDIGKIGIPARILAKAGPLSTSERALVEIPPDHGRADPRADRTARRGAPHRPLRPRALRRHGISGPSRRRADPARVADRPRLRRLRRDDDRPPVPQVAGQGRGEAPPRGRVGNAVRPAGGRRAPTRARPS